MEVCSVTKKCGSCAYQGVPYNEQLKKKKKEPKKKELERGLHPLSLGSADSLSPVYRSLFGALLPSYLGPEALRSRLV